MNIIDAFVKQNRKGNEKIIKILQKLKGQSPLFGVMQKRFQRRGKGGGHGSLDFAQQREGKTYLQNTRARHTVVQDGSD